MIKITSIFVSYRFLRLAWHYILSLSDHFPTRRNSVYIPRDLAAESKSKCSSSLVRFNAWTSQRLLIWKTPPCLKFGKTSNRIVENLPQRKLWVWAANDASSRTSANACFFGQRWIFALSSSDPINYEVCLLRVSEWLICISPSLQ